jgi:murein DD-endopeptidase MepM/ murein hydrolase activator NlpD
MPKPTKSKLFTIVVLIGLLPLAYLAYASALRGGLEGEARSFFPPGLPGFFPVPLGFERDQVPQEEQVRQAIQEAISAQGEMNLAYLLYDVRPANIRISDDEQVAAAWLVMHDTVSGDPVPSEPGLAFTVRESGAWRAILPGEPGWLEALQTAPPEVLAPEAKAEWLLMYEQAAVDVPSEPLTGYLLPWAAGKVVNLSQSVSHDRYNPSGNAHYAFDFYVYKTMWEIHASKAGTVWLWKDDVSNDDNSGSGNFIVLQDTTTTPVTYQLYLHLAQNSIPPVLKVRGAPVMQGQFIGIADNTGQSTGHHLHFHVHTTSTYYWGKSVDITFADVPINGGRPRRMDAYVNELPYCLSSDVCEEGRASYVSANVVQGDSLPPQGDILNLTTGDVVSTQFILLGGWAQDEGSGIKDIQLIARYNGAWREVGPPQTASPFTYEWDLCSQGVPDGPVSLALRLVDWHGNQAPLAGLKHFTKAYACAPAPPACIPSSNQIALFSQPNFEGQCTLFSTGDHTTTAGFPDDGAASMRVGSGVWATLFSGSSLSGRSGTYLSSDSNLSDDAVGTKTVSSLRVKSRSTLPYVPVPLWPPAGFNIDSTASTSLFWQDAGGGVEFQVRWTGESESLSEWQSQPAWHLGGLAPGSYTWQVRARNANGESDWSSSRALLVSELPFPSQSSAALPYLYDVETQGGWSGTGLWQRDSTPGAAHSGEYAWRYGEGSGTDVSYNGIRTGSLTSPPVRIPSIPSGSSKRPYLRFHYRYQSETQGKHWDQRWLQVSDGGSFRNLLQLSDDPMQYWLQSPYIDLSEFAGKDIRIRFYFTSLDESGNDYEGWYIDDLEVRSASLPECSTNPTTGGVMSATTLQVGQRVSGEICPPGDIDYYVFKGASGDRLVFDVDAHSLGSDLDGILHLLDSDGTSHLASHDDELIGILYDPHLGYHLPWDGDYYLKLQAWNHPEAGGENHAYELSLSVDNTPPTASITYPLPGSTLPLELTVKASASDGDSGISHVEFYWHSADWLNSDWVSLGSDWTGEDGWSMKYSASTEQDGAAFYIRVYDWAGNWTGAGAWELLLSKNPGSRIHLPVITHLARP